MTIKNNAVIADACSQRITALKKYITPKTEIPIDGTPHKLADVIDVFQRSLDARAEVTVKRSELKASLSKRKEIEDTRQRIDAGLKAWIAVRFGANSQQAHEFGYPPRKATKKDVATKWHAVEQSKATRDARHTMGKREKAKIKGTVVQTAPVESPSRPNGVASAASSNGASNGASH